MRVHGYISFRSCAIKSGSTQTVQPSANPELTRNNGPHLIRPVHGRLHPVEDRGPRFYHHDNKAHPPVTGGRRGSVQKNGRVGADQMTGQRNGEHATDRDTLPQVLEMIGSGGEDRTPDLGIMRPSLYH